MSARRTARLVLRLPQNDQRSSPTPRHNSTLPPVSPRQVSTAPSKESPLSNSVHLPPELSPPWPWNPSETELIRAGYQPAYKPPKPATPAPKPEASSSSKRARKPKPAMAEPRARAARHKGQMNFSSERKQLLPSKPFSGRLPANISFQSVSCSWPTAIQAPTPHSPPSPSPKQSAS